MTVLITLIVAGTDTGPFSLFSDLDAYTSAFETGVSQSALIAGYPSALVPDFTSIVRIVSTGNCTNFTDVPLYTPTSTTSSTSSTTTTSTTILNSCYQFQSNPYTSTFTAQYVDCNGVLQTVSNTCFTTSCTYSLCGRNIVSSSVPMNIIGPCTTTTSTTL